MLRSPSRPLQPARASFRGSALAASGEGGDFAGGVDALPDSAAEGIVDGVADAGGAAEKGARRR